MDTFNSSYILTKLYSVGIEIEHEFGKELYARAFNLKGVHVYVSSSVEDCYTRVIIAKMKERQAKGALI